MLKRSAAAALLIALAACSGSGGTGGVTPHAPAPPTAAPFPPLSLNDLERIGGDPYANASSQHATVVEPSAAVSNLTIVTAFQAGRFYNGGASDIGFATSLDGGTTWQNGYLPQTTLESIPAGVHSSISDPAVAYDARHATWLISTLPVDFTANAQITSVAVSRSPDGMTWSAPGVISSSAEQSNDKNWIACDSHPASPYFGHCYVEWDTYSGNGEIWMSTSSDGGVTWSAPVNPGASASSGGGIGGQPVTLNDGTVVVPIDDIYGQRVLAFASHDGGQSWSLPVTVATIADHLVAANLRSMPLVSAAADASGNVYVVWHDCRFRQNCAANDLVLSTSSDGVHWSAVTRIPAFALTDPGDSFIPGLGIDPATGGASAHLGITFYHYAQANCTPATCELSAQFIASQDGGATWTSPLLLAGPMNVGWLPQTDAGAMVGDYMATAFASGRPVAFASIAQPLASGRFDQALYVPNPATAQRALQSVVRRNSAGERPVPGFHSDHPPRRLHP